MIIHDVPQRSLEWKALRSGLPTASEFACLVTPTGKLSTQYKDYAATLANELFLGDDEPDGFEGNAWTDRGAALEPQAIFWYEFITDATVDPCGFVTDDKKQYGCSPDGMVGKPGMLEIKALKAVHHTSALQEWKSTGQAPAKYKPQTQGQMMVCGKEWCDLLFFHDALPPFIVRQTPDEAMVELLKKQLSEVLSLRDAILRSLKEA